VGVAVTTEANDCTQLLPAVDYLEQSLNKRPQQMVADRGYTTRENIEKIAGRQIDILRSMWFVPCGANLPNRFPPSAFLYQPERDRYEFCDDPRTSSSVQLPCPTLRCLCRRGILPSGQTANV